jgi:hypothetical protein
VPDIAQAYMRMRDFERRTAADSSPCAALSWLYLRMQLVPLRHILAVTLTSICLGLLQLLVQALLGSLADDADTPDIITAFATVAISAQTAVTIFGALSLALSLWNVSGDVITLLEAHRRAWDAESRAGEAQPFAKVGDDEAAVAAPAPHEAAHYTSTLPLFFRDIAAGSRCLLALVGGSGTTAPPAPPHVLDLSAYSYTDAPGYILMLATTLLFVCFIAGLVFAGLAFFLVYPPLRDAFLVPYLLTLVGSYVFRLIVIRTMRCCCARGDLLLMPRAFMALDAALSLVVSGLFSVSLGLTRVTLALVWALLAASQLSGPCLPPAIALLDTGYASYGAMLKLTFAVAIDPPCAPAPGMVAGA